MIRIAATMLALWAGLLAAADPARATVLYAVSGDGAAPAETLYTLSLADATPQLQVALGNGSAGEEISGNPDDDLIYHFSGDFLANNNDFGPIMETIDPGTLTVTNVVTTSSFVDENAILSSTYDPAGEIFLVVNQARSLYSVTTDGTDTLRGVERGMDHDAKGLAFVGTTLYSLDNTGTGVDGANLRVIDPADGTTLSGPVAVTLAGFTINNGISLALHPETDILYAVFKIGGGTGVPGNRVLTTLDPTTGVATLVGVPGIAVASITFAPEPTSLALGLFALGALALLRSCGQRRGGAATPPLATQARPSRMPSIEVPERA